MILTMESHKSNNNNKKTLIRIKEMTLHKKFKIQLKIIYIEENDKLFYSK